MRPLISALAGIVLALLAGDAGVHAALPAPPADQRALLRPILREQHRLERQVEALAPACLARDLMAAAGADRGARRRRSRAA